MDAIFEELNKKEKENKQKSKEPKKTKEPEDKNLNNKKETIEDNPTPTETVKKEERDENPKTTNSDKMVEKKEESPEDSKEPDNKEQDPEDTNYSPELMSLKKEPEKRGKKQKIFYLSRNLNNALEYVSDATDRSQAELVREALKRFFNELNIDLDQF